MNWDDLLVEAFSNRIRVRILRLLSSTRGGMNISKIARTLNVSYSSAERNLEALRSVGILEEVRLGRVRIYRLSGKREVRAVLRCLMPHELEGLREDS
ncbi:MAG: winged helix-turn-helix domain-containing protein [Candidatus Korarchaeota archaeon]|nr:winged helix-turn-helix domain-containing protein [Candidatus Korarchaeota archaeon]